MRGREGGRLDSIPRRYLRLYAALPFPATLGPWALPGVLIAQNFAGIVRRRSSSTRVAVALSGMAVSAPLSYALLFLSPGRLPFDGMVMSESFFALLLVAHVLAVLRFLERPDWCSAGWAGATLGAALLLRTTVQYLWLVTLAAFVFAARRRFEERLGAPCCNALRFGSPLSLFGALVRTQRDLLRGFRHAGPGVQSGPQRSLRVARARLESEMPFSPRVGLRHDWKHWGVSTSSAERGKSIAFSSGSVRSFGRTRSIPRFRSRIGWGTSHRTNRRFLEFPGRSDWRTTAACNRFRFDLLGRLPYLTSIFRIHASFSGLLDCSSGAPQSCWSGWPAGRGIFGFSGAAYFDGEARRLSLYDSSTDGIADSRHRGRLPAASLAPEAPRARTSHLSLYQQTSRIDLSAPARLARWISPRIVP